MEITGRKVLITGAGSGIGRELAVRFGAAGSAVAVVGRRVDALEETARRIHERGGAAYVVPADLADRNSITGTVDSAAAQLGGLDVVVNNAGNVSAGELESISQSDIEAMIDINLLAPILVTRAALPHVKIAGAGLILGISSGIALVGLPYYTVYSAVKAGLANFGEALRRELLDTGIRVATVYPGATATPMMDSSEAGDDLGFGRRPLSEVIDEVVAGVEAEHRSM